ncbi:MAG TPA: hypothetical protein VFF28_05415 [Candidatus Nanoarchaeia archaeon]|nr:hypothetical protein [Candidatus Nanoarchaeia archaeon]
MEAAAFVVQKHEISMLQYDFRVVFKDMIKSWAIFRGPSEQKQLAIEVDHADSLDCKLWDEGTCLIQQDLEAALKSGKLSLILEGEKLRGYFVLQKLEKGNVWLFKKERIQ